MWILFVAALSFMSSVANCQETWKLKGFVQTKDGHRPVGSTTVGIHGREYGSTSPQGDFALSLSSQVQVGYPVVFYVEGWLVVEPAYNGVNGQVPLPAPGAGDVYIFVAKRGERGALLSDKAIEAMLLGSTSHFKKLAGPEQSALQSTRPNTSKAGRDLHYISTSTQYVPPMKYFQAWLAEESQVIDISKGEIEAAILAWSKRSTSDLDQGLASLYYGDLEKATTRLVRAAEQEHQTAYLRAEANQALAFGYALARNYGPAEQILRKAFMDTGGVDPNFLLHLGNVLRLDDKPEEAEEAFSEAHKLMLRNGFLVSRKSKQSDSTPEPPAPSIPHHSGLSGLRFSADCADPAFPGDATPADSACGLEGNDKELEASAKNDFCASGDPETMNFADFKKLQSQVAQKHNINWGDKNTATRLKGPAINRHPLEQMGEGNLVVINGFILSTREERAESVNCGKDVPDEPAYHDIRISLVASADETNECNGIVGEMSPHHRPAEWTRENLEKLAKGHTPVRIAGHLFFDSKHVPCAHGKPVSGNPARFSLWEVHPIYQLEVCTFDCGGDGHWTTLSDWLRNSQ